MSEFLVSFVILSCIESQKNCKEKADCLCSSYPKVMINEGYDYGENKQNLTYIISKPIT